MNKSNQICFNKSRNQNILYDFSTLSQLIGMNDSTLNEYYNQFSLKQANMLLDSRMLALIAKMNEEKMFESLKTQFDEDKKKLLDKILKNINRSKSDYSITNHLNLKNFHTQLNKNYTYDAADNQLIISFFDKIKTRKRKVYKAKKNEYIDILYSGTTSPQKSKNRIKNENSKNDNKLLLKSHSDFGAYYRRKQNNLNIQRVNYKKDKKKEEKNKLNEDEKKTFEIKKTISKLRFIRNKRRKSVRKILELNEPQLSVILEENKNAKVSFNLPDIKTNNKINNTKDNILKNKLKEIKINDSLSSEKSLRKDIDEPSMTITKDKDTIKMQLLKNNIIKITQKNKEKKKTLPKETEKKEDLNQSKKIMSKTINAKFLKEKYATIKIKITDNERIQYMNRIYKQRFNKVISDFNEREKKIEKKYTKINNLLYNLKNSNKGKDSNSRVNSPQKDKNIKINQNKKLIDYQKEDSPRKTSKFIFREWNAATSLYHFPLINKVIYKNKQNFDDIEKIKTNLKREYSNKLKRNRQEYTRKIDGKRIMKKLNDKFELERLREYSEDLREKQIKKEQFEVIEL